MGGNNKDIFLKLFGIIGGIFLADFFLFPLTFSFYSLGNSKIYMAIITMGILLLQGGNLVSNKGIKSFVILCCYALGLSIINYFSIVVNNTCDYTYVTYIISMLVWLAGAFALVCYLDFLHKGLTLQILVYYLLAVCALQCVSAVIIDNNLDFENFVCRLVVGQRDALEFAERLCGISCSFDTAGIRFAVVLVMSFFILPVFLGDDNLDNFWKILFLIGITIVIVIGNMISRTTTVGALIGIVYILYVLIFARNVKAEQKHRTIKWMIFILAIAIPIIAILYKTNYNFREELRFGFEGFFSLVESGEWNVHSNNVLQNMVVFPDNLKTWCIGDGFFIDTTQDPWYVGKTYEGYYMDTDIGYLRFIFYFGLLGLSLFTLFFVYATEACISFFPKYYPLLLFLFLLQLIVWFKVSTDIFFIFAIFLSWGFLDRKSSYEKS